MCSAITVNPVALFSGPASKLTMNGGRANWRRSGWAAVPNWSSSITSPPARPEGRAAAIEDVGEALVVGRVALAGIGDDHAPRRAETAKHRQQRGELAARLLCA